MAAKKIDTAAVETSAKSIGIPKMKIGHISLWLIGITPLVLNPFDGKTRAQMLGKHMGAAKQGREVKDPVADVNRKARERMTDDGRYGVPAVMFKAAAVSACRSVQAKMTEARQAFFVRGNILPIYGSQPVAWESMVRNDNGAPDIRFRPVFEEWAINVEIDHDAGLISEAQILNLFERAGYGVGVGDWRPEKSASGQCGRFRLASTEVEVREWSKRIPRVETIPVHLSDETQMLLDGGVSRPASAEPEEELPAKAKRAPKSNGHAQA